MFHTFKMFIFGYLVLTTLAFPFKTQANSLINFYQKRISAIDGNRCPMKPSCSEYARQAIEKHGPVLGWIMACDRLLRCGRSQKNIGKIDKENGHKIVDTLEDNDFWWFSSTTKNP